jgi:hypothetical protein
MLIGILSTLQKEKGVNRACFSELAPTQPSLNDAEAASSDVGEGLTLSMMDDMIVDLRRDRDDAAEMLDMQQSTDKYTDMLLRMRSGQPLSTDEDPESWEFLLEEVHTVNAKSEHHLEAVLAHQSRLTDTLAKLRNEKGTTRVWELCD